MLIPMWKHFKDKTYNKETLPSNATPIFGLGISDLTLREVAINFI